MEVSPGRFRPVESESAVQTSKSCTRTAEFEIERPKFMDYTHIEIVVAFLVVNFLDFFVIPQSHEVGFARNSGGI